MKAPATGARLSDSRLFPANDTQRFTQKFSFHAAGSAWKVPGGEALVPSLPFSAKVSAVGRWLPGVGGLGECTPWWVVT